MAYNILHNTQQEGCNLQLIKTNEEKINKMKFGTAFLQTKPVEKLLCIGISVGILIILVFFLAIGIVIYYSGRCHGTTLTDTQLRQMMVAINQESPDNSDRPKESTSESEVDTRFDSTTHDTTRDTSLTRTIGGPTYIRWGRTICRNDTELVYDGYSAGKKWNKYGSGANYLCLTKNPEWGDLQTRGTISELYGVEIDAPDVADSLEVPCSVCRLLFRFSLVMIPGRKTCPKDWTVEYWGYLMSESSLYKNRMSTEYVCVDNEWEHYGTTNNDNAVWYFTKGMCGSLPCPPYINGKLLTCVVCSR
ncbi:Hypothetical predicted protein [Mytilus galloprovincialis]|uniref:Uncharacterized protein n=1 Tax=Mytilus galloprovincialis TaxID=29158 RepID=A0A8B6BDJ8_MYTGA|nr:Hypothetical predicted protein [Mytilus galloprovincialis]